MKKLSILSLSSILILSSSLLFTGCLEDIKKKFQSAGDEVEKVIYPVPNCSDKEVIYEVNKKLTNHALYGTHAQVKFGTILYTGSNEETEEKSCKAVVTYSIDEKDNKISSFFSKIPVIKNVSKDRTITYSIQRGADNKTFIVNVH
jgi:hypothetical protein